MSGDSNFGWRRNRVRDEIDVGSVLRRKENACGAWKRNDVGTAAR
jgi:hypothetical protein